MTKPTKRKKLEPKAWIDPCIEEAVAGARMFHEHRDMMNAALHRDTVRWSSLTEELRKAHAALRRAR